MDKFLRDENAIDAIEAKLKPERRTSPNRRIRKHLSSKRWEAKMSFLERIHQEVWDKRPEWEKEQIEAERRGEEPELTPYRPEISEVA